MLSLQVISQVATQITSINVALAGVLLNFIGLIIVVITFSYNKNRNRMMDKEKIATKVYVDKEIDEVKKDITYLNEKHHDSIEEIKVLFEKTISPIKEEISDIKTLLNKQEKNFYNHIREQHLKK